MPFFQLSELAGNLGQKLFEKIKPNPNKTVVCMFGCTTYWAGKDDVTYKALNTIVNKYGINNVVVIYFYNSCKEEPVWLEQHKTPQPPIPYSQFGVVNFYNYSDKGFRFGDTSEVEHLLS
jgi:hypothetical protein